ncbi:MAG: hypothetical protein GX608_01490, partial [Lentisphaerae bacterium]|nr:hypothetical protein [Lentisphaerota bacterium]
MVALVALEAQSERVLQGVTETGQGGDVGPFHAQAGVVGIGCEQAGDILGRGEGRVVEQHPLEVFEHAFALLVGGFAG